MKKTSDSPGRVGLISLGCSKALVDSEQIVTQLRAEGYDISTSSEDADLVIINTCGFIDAAITESLDTIEETLKQNNRVIVTGCLGAKDNIVQNEFPELLAVTGPHATSEVMQAVHDALPKQHDPHLDLVPAQGIKLTPSHYAYLKISEGCNHKCSFCIIPALRGKLHSRPVDEVLEEAARLADGGVKELLVISQDTSAYGVDLKYETRFWRNRPVKTDTFNLTSALGDLGVWVRLHYVYPYPHVDQLIPLMADNKILPYLDIPFQHASPRTLKAMRRPANSENVLERLQRWREVCPELKIRSTFIVGFPGETDQDFDLLLDFLEDAQLDRVGCFTYSAVEGAAANEIGQFVPDSVKQERQQTLMETQAEISANKLDAMIDEELTILIDGIDGDQLIGRSYGEAPEVDGVVVIDYPAEKQSMNIRAGDFVQAQIVHTDEHDMFGELVETKSLG